MSPNPIADPHLLTAAQEERPAQPGASAAALEPEPAWATDTGATARTDVHAAPAPEEDGAPLTPTEWTVASVWAEVLRVPRVRRGDNFFDLGGDSLLLIRVHARLRERVGPHVQMPDLMQHRTLGALARRLDAPPGQEAEQAALERAGTRRALTARAGAVRAALPPGKGADDE